MRVLLFGSPTSKGYEAFQNNRRAYGGGWVEGLVENLKRSAGIELYVMFYANFVHEVRFVKFEDVTYFAIPTRIKDLSCCNKLMIEDLRYVVEFVKPNVTHIIGTEREHNIRLFEMTGSESTVLSVTGLSSVYSQHYLAGIHKSSFLIPSIGDILRHRGPLVEKRLFEKYGQYEIEMIRNARHIMGRTTWDYACIKRINPKIDYAFCGEILNDSVFHNRWSADHCVKYRIFVSQGSYPIKGLHMLIEAVSIIREKFPDCSVHVAGADILTENTIKDRLKQTTYARYIKNKMKRFHITSDVIHFTGPLSQDEMTREYLECNVFVLPSIIENSSNSLGEAMCLGVPCVTACVGGAQDMIRDRQDGFIYPYDEPYMLAYYVSQLFESKELCYNMGLSAREYAMIRFDNQKIVDTTIAMYRKISK